MGKIKPEQGMLTFFNGQKIYHGVEKVLNKDRKKCNLNIQQKNL
tara:strand:- start:913 stop:1044 length:132 start_codon:yes stop_codon:yes gene_type:complete